MSSKGENKKTKIEQEKKKEESYIEEDTVRVGKYEEAPDYLKDNEYIRNGYLLNCHTMKLCLKALITPSNETINVWSHLLGCVIAIIYIFLTAIFVSYSINYIYKYFDYSEFLQDMNTIIENEDNNNNGICEKNPLNFLIQKEINENDKFEQISRWPLFVMLAAAIVCFGFSTTFHWFSIYSAKVYAFLTKLDYGGITFLIPGSCCPPYFYFYYCHPCNLIFLFI